ncbi:exo-beta-N-acetylmuramidase NamZ domain-containing protein [Laceyella putida]|uniref:Exo-beta-N-acetylmuramidase NamZ domain-containing protein n=1 Tax=Laceyella putida TaxID=110101 RepID=A0ABW2RR32_9BACL
MLKIDHNRWWGITLGFVIVLATFTFVWVNGEQEAAQGYRGRVLTGLDEVLTHPGMFAGQRVGLITNPTGITADYQHALDAMLAKGIKVTEVYGPEHGVRGTEQAGDTPGELIDPKTGLPLTNLYGKKPAEMVPLFEDVDVLVFDIQDVGARFYTYIYTMAYAMEAAALADKPFYVLDRPNPLGGDRVEGPVLEEKHSSFIGLFPIALRHGMTVGELATMFNEAFFPKAGKKKVELHVVRMKGWSRQETFEKTNLPWVMPSPNMPTVMTAQVYPGTGLIEATNLSEGRGTTRPFELVGAPYIEGWKLAEALNREQLPGVTFREAYYTPSFSKYQGKAVGGVQVHVTDPASFDPILTGLAIIEKTKKLYPNQFAWRESGEPYWMDKMTGSEKVRQQIDQGKSAKEIVHTWTEELNSFKELREKYLLYPGRGIPHLK